MATDKKPQMVGPQVVADHTNAKEVGFYLQSYMDKHGKPPKIIMVNSNVKADDVKVPEEFDVQVQCRPFVLPGIIWIGEIKVYKGD